jgi:hypothetical protein
LLSAFGLPNAARAKRSDNSALIATGMAAREHLASFGVSDGQARLAILMPRAARHPRARFAPAESLCDDPAKMMLGPCRGGVVRLAEPGEVGEGIETCLAAMRATGHPAWAALSTSGLRTLDLPDAVRDVIVLADGDEPGEAAAQVCTWRWKRQGRRARVARPPQGMDFNDLLMVRAPRIEEGAL